MRPPSASHGHPFWSARRREVARACAFGARTTSDVARQLAAERGSVTSVLDALVNEGVLRITTVTHSTGNAYELVPRWRRRLVAAVGSADPRGVLQPGGRLLLVGSRDAAALAEVIEAIAADPVVVWCARVDGQARLLVAARGETDEEVAGVDGLEAMIERRGLDCVQLRVDRVMELSELEGYARTLTSEPRPPALPRPRGG